MKRHRTPGPIRQSYALIATGNEWRWVAVGVLALVVSALEAAGTALIFVLLSLITEPSGGVEIPVIGDLTERFPDTTQETLIIASAVSIGIFFLARGTAQVIQSYIQNRISYNSGARLSVRLVRGYLSMPYQYHLGRESALSIRNAISAVQEVVGRVVLPATKFFAEVMIVLGMSVVLFLAAPLASVLVIVVVVPLTYLILRLVRSRVKQYGKISFEASQASLQTLQESLHGVREIRLLGRESYFVRRFRTQRARDAAARTHQATFLELTSVLIELIMVLFIVAFVIFTVVATGTAGESFAILGLFAYVAMRLKPSIQKIMSAANNLRFAAPAIEDLHHDLDQTSAAVQQVAQGGRRNQPLDPSGKIRLENVTFQYPGGEQPAAKDVNIEFQIGESVGFCGPTGGGKSTLVDIIAGLLEPTHGRVTANGEDIGVDIRSWYQRIGFVSQDLYLFDDTLRNNIALGVSAENIDEEALAEAVRIAQLDEFVSGLSNGLDTRVGEHGTLLSGGQRQRVAIARALYRNPEILLLDEGTSALDNEVERHFIEALHRFQADRTVVLVAHRLSTIRDCDRVYFVEGGRVYGGGSYDELYEANASFRRMAV